MVDVALKTVGDFNKQFKNCSGFKKYTRKNSEYFVINDELFEMFSVSGAGKVNLTGYNNKKFTTSFPVWVDKFICSIKFTISTINNGLPLKIKCIENTHAQHTTKSDTIYGCLGCTDKDNKSWYMEFAFKENISVGTEIDLSEYLNYIEGVHSYYNTRSITLSGASSSDFKVIGNDYTLFKDINLFNSEHQKNPVI